VNFVVDSMLGKLVRWLRILGQDVLYSNSLSDAQLEKIAKAEKRALLTRDFELYRHAISRGIETLYVDGATEAEKLAQVARRFDVSLTPNMTISRCPKCNGKIHPVPKVKIAHKVMLNTLSNYEAFWECPNCGQVYWQGSHWVKIQTVLFEARRNLAVDTKS
jgi:uncharacterized protein with PIN domain